MTSAQKQFYTSRVIYSNTVYQNDWSVMTCICSEQQTHVCKKLFLDKLSRVCERDHFCPINCCVYEIISAPSFPIRLFLTHSFEKSVWTW